MQVQWTFSGREKVEISFSDDGLLGDGSAAAAASFGILDTGTPFSYGLEFWEVEFSGTLFSDGLEFSVKIFGEVRSFAAVDTTGCKSSRFLMYYPLAGTYVVTGILRMQV